VKATDNGPSSNKRENERVAIDVPVEFKGENGDLIEARTLNVSRGGMFIQTARPLREGSRAFFRVQLKPQSLQFHLEAEVVWSRRNRNRGGEAPKGMGIRFLVSPSLSAKTLDGVLSVLRTAQP
jgi:uncharacterized protein (TIGR02266 family)